MGSFTLETLPAGDNCAVLRVNGEVDVYTAPELRERVVELLADDFVHLIVDLRDVVFLDSTGIGALVGILRRVRAQDGSLMLVTSSERLLNIFEVTGLGNVFDIYPEVEDAIAASEPWQTATKTSNPRSLKRMPFLPHHLLGHSGVEVTELGFGGGPLGGLYTEVARDTAAAALAAAWEGGIRYFDTSPHYGIGQSERWFGDLLRHKPRAEYTLSTKVGRILVPQDADGRMDEAFQVPATHRRVWDFSRDGIVRSVEDSLSRIGVDRIDVLFLHDAEQHFEAALRSGYPALADLRAQGMVGAIGAGMYDPALLTRLVRETDADVLMLAGHYTLLTQDALDDLFPACAERGVSVLAASVFNSGVLATSRPTDSATFDYLPAPPDVLRRAGSIADVCEAYGVTLPQAAMAFPLLHPVVAGIVVGMRSESEVRANLAAFGAEIPARLWSDLRTEGLIDERATPAQR